ncbi:MAG: porin family protein [Methylocystis sp.]|nr:porin family protein [Methylocystis sp.]
MKNTISTLAIVAAFAAGSAFAADLPSRKGPPILPPPAFTWTGFYLGLNVGGGWRDNNNNNNGFTPFPFVFLPTGTNGGNGGGVVGGGQSGFNYQLTPLFVVGWENDFQGTSIGSGGGGGFGGDERITYFGTVRGRIGVTPLDPRLLVYGTGGFAYGRVERDEFFFEHKTTKTGWTAGGGVEYAFMPNLSAKVEYLFTNLNSGDDNGFAFVFNNHHETRFHTVRAGVNYHYDLFGLLAQAPVFAKY